MSGLEALSRELDLWKSEGCQAGFWWRDDDLGAPTDKLEPLLGVASDLAMPPLLAVVPDWATPGLARRLAGLPVRVAVHGKAHINHQAGRGKKSEFGPSRPIADCIADAAAGRARLVDLFGPDLVACFVPPWNRMAPALAEALPSLEYQGLSTFGARREEAGVAGLNWVNTHVDVINWRGDRGFVGADCMAANLADQLTDRRQERCGTQRARDEPTGILSHHLEMTVDDWRGFAMVCSILTMHPAAKMLDSRALLMGR
ncbi:MAG: polysaccharide deacetylase family protein [Proteobacteria bacterium]|nr:polysaccharide deacetylase family protein [Pseudomonadota bacterium]